MSTQAEERNNNNIIWAALLFLLALLLTCAFVFGATSLALKTAETRRLNGDINALTIADYEQNSGVTFGALGDEILADAATDEASLRITISVEEGALPPEVGTPIALVTATGTPTLLPPPEIPEDPSPTPTFTPTSSPSFTPVLPTPTSTATPTITPEPPTGTPTSTATSTSTPSPTTTSTVTPTPSATPTLTFTPLPPAPTDTPGPNITNTPTFTLEPPTVTFTPTPSLTPTPSQTPTPTPTHSPTSTVTPTPSPTATHTPTPTFTPTPVGEAILVVGDPSSLNAVDTAVRDRLQALNFIVSVVDDNVITAPDAEMKDLVFVSDTVDAATLGSNLLVARVPIIVSKSELYDEMGMTNGVDNGSSLNQTDIDISDPAHPMAAGFSGTITVLAASGNMGWGIPDNANIVAGVPGELFHQALFGYDTNVFMPGNIFSPGVRVGFFLPASANIGLTSEGWQIFDAVIIWAFESP